MNPSPSPSAIPSPQPASARPGVPPAAPDLAAIKARQQAAWASGNYAVVGTRLQLVGETLCESAGIRAGERVLDVATGNGNAALAAARRFARVTGVDYVPALLAQARARAAADGLELELREGDAEALPFEDGAFDAVLSTFGVMFAPDQPRAARELARVCRPRGRIGLASWTPGSFVGALFRVIGRHVPPPAGLRSPAMWGVEEEVRSLFGAEAPAIRFERRTFVFQYHSPEHFLEVFRSWYGPVHRAFAALDARGQEALAADIVALVREHAAPGPGPLSLPSAYLEAVITRR